MAFVTFELKQRRSAELSSACWCFTWCSRRFIVSIGWDLRRVYQSVLQGDSLLGMVTLANHISGDAFRARHSKISAYESAGAVKHPVQTWSQVLLYLESMQERRKGQRKIYDGGGAALVWAPDPFINFEWGGGLQTTTMHWTRLHS